MGACDISAAWLTLDENDNDLHLFLSYLLAAVQTVAPAADYKSSYIDSRDISACGAVALTTDKHDNSVITQTGGRALDHYEVAKIISDTTGKTITYYPISEEEYAEDLKSTEMPDDSAEMFLNLYRLLRAGGTAPVSNDVADCLGRPQITFEQYAHDFAKFWK